MHTGRMPCKAESRDHGDASVSQGTPQITSRSLEAREEGLKQIFFHSSQKEPTLLIP